MADNKHHELRLVRFSSTQVRYPKLMCAFCYKLLTEKYRCSACKKTYYCSQNCQENDWPRHYSVCGVESANYNYRYCFVYLPCPMPCLGFYFVDCVYERYFVRFSCDLADISVERGAQNCFLRYQDGALRALRYSNADYDAGYIACQQPNFDANLSGKHLGIIAECPECQASVYSGSLCAKCGKLVVLDDSLASEADLLWKNALIHLLCIQSYKLLIDKFFPGMVVLQADEFLNRAICLLKQNKLHHLCLCVVHISMRVLQVVYCESGAFRAISAKLNDLSLFGVCFACLKGALHHYGHCDQTFKTALLATRVLNFYTLNELEALAPSCMREFNESVHTEQQTLSDAQLEEIRRVALPLLREHERALDFGRQLQEMAYRIGDERIALECENLVGQIDCRVENLESWIYDAEDSAPDLRVMGNSSVRCAHDDTGQPDSSEANEGEVKCYSGPHRIDLL